MAGDAGIFNSDQGSQFTSDAFTTVLKRSGVTISMDGRGRSFDNVFVERLWRNVKHEDVYLNGYANMSELMVGLTGVHFNRLRPTAVRNILDVHLAFALSQRTGAE